LRHSTAASRLLAIATLAALVSATFGVSATAGAREPGGGGRQLQKDARPGSQPMPERASRRVVVRDLPTAESSGASFKPTLRRPDASISPRAPLIALAASPPTPVLSGGLQVATESTTFSGLAADAAVVEPPDPWVAVGPEHVIQAVNTTIRFSNRSGAALGQVSLLQFFDLVQPGYNAIAFDPRVIYDSLHGRWIAIATHFDCVARTGSPIGAGWIDIAVSTSADPLGIWDVYYDPFADSIPDYPGIGTSTDKVVLSSNVFSLVSTPGDGLGCEPSDTDFLGTELDVLAWSQLIGTGAINLDFFIGGLDYPNNYFTWRPALQAPATSATAYVVGENFAAGNGVTYTTLTGDPATGTTALSAMIELTTANAIAGFAIPPVPKQPGLPATIARAVDDRPTDAVWQGNHLAFVSTYPCDTAGGVAEDRDCVRVSELLTTSVSPSVIQDFVISEESHDLYMGGVGFAGNGDLHAVWTRSSEIAGRYPSSWAAEQLATDAAGTLRNPHQLAAGTASYPGERWGDYVGVAQDPQVPNAVWQANQYAAGAGWATRVSQLQTGGNTYVPITPLRVVNSNPPSPVGVTGIFNANVPRTFQVRDGGSIPLSAIAVTGNVTVVHQTQAGYVSVTPTATTTPSSSTINFPVGDVRANNFTLPLDATGRLAAVYKAAPGQTTHVLVDITGYFVPGNVKATYVPHPNGSVRIMDTRPIGHIGPLNTFHDGAPQTLSVAGENGVPPEATAITGNLTVVGQTKAGYLSVTPDPPVGVINSSTLNFPVGDTRANGLTADLNGDGDLSITYKGLGGTANVILDVTGYYLPDTSLDHDSGLLFYPLNPGRVLDSRPGRVLTGLAGTFSSNVSRPLAVGGHWGAPTGAAAVTGNLTVVNQTAAGYVSITKLPTNSPTTSTINFPVGDVRANGVTVPTNSGSDISLVYKVSNITGKTTHLILDMTGYFK
jgi:hypothetical protein